MTAIFLQGNSRDVLKSLPENFIHCAVTSPPYFGLRRYQGGDEVWGGSPDCQHKWSSPLPVRHKGRVEQTKWKDADAAGNGQTQPMGNICVLCGAWRGQLGNEPTPDLYIRHLVEICREVKRVLRKDGVFWINVGDSWSGSGKGQMGDGSHAAKHGEKQHTNTGAIQGGLPAGFVGDGCKPLDMVLIPSLLALALRADGWWVRSIIVWSKNNPMPESVNGVRYEKHKVKTADGWADCLGCPKCAPHNGYVLRKGSWRPTDSYEHILMLTKTDDYYCDREAVLEQGVYPNGEMRLGGDDHKSLDAGSRTTEGLHNKDWVGNGFRNLRSVWSFPTKPFSGAHFATYPPRLVELAVRSSTSEHGCCPTCGSPYARMIDKGFASHDGQTEGGKESNSSRIVLLRQAARENGGEYTNNTSTVGWLPTCSCKGNNEPAPCRVLDPFSGAGTTAMVCERLGLDSFSIDTSAEYIALAKQRLIDDEQKRCDEFVKQVKRKSKEASKASKVTP